MIDVQSIKFNAGEGGVVPAPVQGFPARLGKFVRPGFIRYGNRIDCALADPRRIPSAKECDDYAKRILGHKLPDGKILSVELQEPGLFSAAIVHANDKEGRNYSSALKYAKENILPDPKAFFDSPLSISNHMRILHGIMTKGRREPSMPKVYGPFADFIFDLQDQMAALLQKKLNPFEVAAWVHKKIVTLSPFESGNRKMARIFMQTALILGGQKPVAMTDAAQYEKAIQEEQRAPGLFQKYLEQLPVLN